MKAFNYGSLRKSLPLFVALCAMGLQAGAAHAQGWDHKDSLRAGFNPLSQVPSVLAGSHGNLEAEVNEDGAITFQLSYAGMSSSVVQAHIHFGASKTNGGVAVFLCGGGVTPACPASGTVTGTITAADVSVLPATNGDSVIPRASSPGIWPA